jgi:hypothetical protein
MKCRGEAIATSASLIDFWDLAMVSINMNAWAIASPLRLHELCEVSREARMGAAPSGPPLRGHGQKGGMNETRE